MPNRTHAVAGAALESWKAFARSRETHARETALSRALQDLENKPYILFGISRDRSKPLHSHGKSIQGDNCRRHLCRNPCQSKLRLLRKAAEYGTCAALVD